MSQKIKQGLVESPEMQEKNAYVLMTMKYLGIILKIIRNSFLEALSCQENQDGDNGTSFGNSEA